MFLFSCCKKRKEELQKLFEPEIESPPAWLFSYDVENRTNNPYVTNPEQRPSVQVVSPQASNVSQATNPKFPGTGYKLGGS